MEENDLKNKNEISLIEKINPIIIFKNLFQFFNKENEIILPLLLSEISPQYKLKFEQSTEKILNDDHEENINIKIEVNKLIKLFNFFLNCKNIYKELYFENNLDITTINDPIMDMYNKVEKITKNINEVGINYKKLFYNYLSNVPFINISPCCSIMNIIYWNEYYKKKDDKNNNKQKIINVILYLNEEIAKYRINDIFGEIIFNQNNYYIKKNKIYFDVKIFMNVIKNIYNFFKEPRKIIVNGGDKIIKHNFKNNEFFIDSILFKLNFKSNSLLIIHRV